MKALAVFAICLAIGPWGRSDAAAAEPTSLEAFAETSLHVSEFRFAEVDLNFDGESEIVLQATDRGWCGSGGCAMFVLTPSDGTYRLITRTTITNAPIRALQSSHNGWRDLTVTVRGGGITQPYTALLRFDGTRYPLNPTVPPATPVSGSTGEVLIDD